MRNDKAAQTKKPDEDHLVWAIDQRAEIQRTLLVLYRFVRGNSPERLDFDTRYLLDLLIGAAFSLWRAVFLAETFRDIAQIHKSQEAFLEKVITDNAITFADDKANRHWTVEYYLENAKFRLERVHQLRRPPQEFEANRRAHAFFAAERYSRRRTDALRVGVRSLYVACAF